MITTQLFRDRNLAGRFRTLTFPIPDGTFLARNGTWFRSEGINDRLSSLSVVSTANETTATILYLFQHKNYSGRFLSIPVLPGSNISENDLRTRNIDNRASSALLIRRHPNECAIPFNLTQMLTPQIQTLVDTIMPTVEADRRIRRAWQRRLPEISWEVFPDFDPLHQLLRVRVFLRVDPRSRILRRRNITITVWFALVPADDGTLTAFFVRRRVDANRGFIPARAIERIVRGGLEGARGGIETMMQRNLFTATRGFPDSGFNIVGMYLMAATVAPFSTLPTPFTGDVERSNIFMFLFFNSPFRL